MTGFYKNAGASKPAAGHDMTWLYDRIFRPAVYNGLQWAVGAHRLRRTLVADYLRPGATDRLLDVGCGTGQILAYLPAVHFVGIDPDPKAIEWAQQTYGARAKFICRAVDDREAGDGLGSPFDIVMAFGVLHHLDDKQVGDLFSMARNALRPGGRLVTVDPCVAPSSSFVARYLMSQDRGRYVRKAEEYANMAAAIFTRTIPTVRNDLYRIPWTHLILECSQTP